MGRSLLLHGTSVAALVLGASLITGGTAYADCAVTSGGGTVGAPASGSTVTCNAVAPFNGNIGSQAAAPQPDGVTVNLQNGAQVIGQQTGPVSITTPNGETYTINVGNSANITVGRNANLVSAGKGTISAGNNLALLLRNGAQVDGNVTTGSDAKITVLNGANLVGGGKATSNAISAGDRLALMLESGGTITGPIVAGGGSSLTIGGHLIAFNPSDPSIILNGTGNRVTLTPGYNIDGLVVGANANLGPPGPGTRDATSVLAFGGAGTASFDVSKIDTQYVNFGQLEKTGTSTFIFTGTTAATLPLTINGGTVRLDGASLAATPTAVNAGGTLSGAGTIGATTIAGGTLAPGAGQIGTLTVNGALSFTQSSTYRIAVSAADASRTNVAGAAAVAGTVAVQTAGTAPTNGMRYTILTAAGGVTGTFNPIVGSNLAFFTPTLAYDANNVFLDSAYNYVIAGGTQNQQNVGAGLNNVANGPLSPAGQRLFGALNLTPNGQAGVVLNALSGEGITASQNIAFRSAQLFNSAIFDQTTFYSGNGAANSITLGAPQPGFTALATPEQTLAAANSGQKVRELADLPSRRVEPAMPAALQRTWRAWGSGFGGVENIQGNGQIGSTGQNNSIIGGAIGVDYQLLPNYLIGVAVGGTDGSFRVPGRATSGSTSGGHIAIYDIANFGAFYGASSSSFSYYGNRTTRVTGGFGGLASETQRGDFNSYQFRNRLEFGRHFDGFGGSLTPFVALEIAQLRSNGFNERAIAGPGLLGLNVQGQSIASVPSFVGFRLQRVTPLGNGMVFSPTLQVAWVHEFAPIRSQAAQIAALPGSVFLVDSARPARDAAQVKAGGELTIGPRTAIFANFDGEFSGVNQLYAGKGGLRYAW